MRTKWMAIVCTVAASIMIIAGCGRPKADLTIFMMGKQGIPAEAGNKLKESLVTKLGPTPTVDLNTSPVFSLEKLVVELAAGDNDIIIVSEEQFEALSQQGGYVPLDDVANPEEYKEGVLEITENGKKETHLYGIPLENTKWMKDLQLNGKGLYAFIPMNAKNIDLAKQVLKVIAEK